MNHSENLSAMTEGKSKRRRLGIIVAGMGLGVAAAYLISKVLAGRIGSGLSDDHLVDDRGTGQRKAARMLRNLRDRAFEASDEKLALALGRPTEEVEGWNAGEEIIDDDVVMKARGIAMHRGVHIE